MKKIFAFILFLFFICPYSSFAQGCFEVYAKLYQSKVAKTESHQLIKNSDVQQAAKRIYQSGLVQKTPLIRSEGLSQKFGRNVFLKLDFEQNIGAFKIRGAANSLLSLIQKRGAIKGVVTASSGNHAQGIALTAKELNIPATIVMAENASQLKIEKVKKLGAEVVLHGHSFEEAEAFAKSFANQSEFDFIHPFANIDVMTGQATIGLEILEQMKRFTPESHNDLMVISPIGGGGLMAGVSGYLKQESTEIQTLGVQALSNSYMAQAILGREDLVKTSQKVSIADGAAVTMVDSDIKETLERNLNFIASVEEEAIIRALLELENEGVYVEGAAALSLAGLNSMMKEQRQKLPQNIVLILTGKNIDEAKRKSSLELL